MTTKKNTRRQSTCVVCGMRMSYKTSSGEIRWRPSHVVDEGLYCEACFKGKDGGKPARKDRP